MMLLRYINPLRALNDLRGYLAQRPPYEVAFFFLSVAIFTLIIAGFVIDSREEPVYRPQIVYVQQWPASRTREEIIAQQKRDAPIEAKRKAEAREAERRKQESFKKLDDKLKQWGL